MAGTREAGNHKILIVDDEYSIREALKLFFEGRGYRTLLAENGLEAMSLIEKEDFDLILSDIRMGKMDGVELIRNMSRYNSKTPVIFITAYPEVNSAIEAVRHGVAEYVVKPFEMKELEEKVRAAINAGWGSSSEKLSEDLKRHKKEFLSKFSHELRAPLTPISAYVKLLLKKEFGEVPVRQAEVIKKIENNSLRLRRVADDLIMLYAIEYAEEPMDIGRAHVSDMLKKAVDEEDIFIREKRQDVVLKIFDGLDEISCDAEKIQKVIFHLLDNAVKFSPNTSDITVNARKYRYCGADYIKFSVRDSSEKIRDMNKRLLFRKFYDMPALNEEPAVYSRGLGLGLTLAKAIVEAHKGRIWLEETEDVHEPGNIFSFILPL